MSERGQQFFSSIMQSKLALGFIFLIVGMSIYAPSLNNRFLLDDESQVLQNDLIHSPANVMTFFSGSTMHQKGTSLGGIYYKPIMSLCYSLLWWISPNNPVPYHVFQLFLAVANAFLLFLFLRRYMSAAIALGVSLIYLTHPLNSEVVVYIADLQDTLYTFFGLLSLNYLAISMSLSFGRLIGFCAILLCSLLSKESGILYVVTSVLFAAVFRRDIWKRVAVGCAGVLGVYFYLRIGVAHLTTMTYAQNQIGRADLETRLITAPAVLASYLWKFIFPRDITATQDWVVKEITWNSFWMPLLFVLAILGLSVWYAIRYWRVNNGSLKFAFFAFWVFMGMGFHSHIFVALDGTVADRWFYYASVGLVAMVGLVLEQVITRAWIRPTAYALIVIIAALGVRSSIRALDWFDNYTLCLHDLQIFPDSYDMHNNLGVEYYRRGNVEEARKEFRKSTELAPMWDINWNNLGATYNYFGDLKTAEEYYLRAMQHGTYFMAYENYAAILVRQGRFAEAKKFISERALPMFPASQELMSLAREIQYK